MNKKANYHRQTRTSTVAITLPWNSVSNRAGSRQWCYGGDFRNGFYASLVTGSLLLKWWNMLLKAAMTKQWTAKWPSVA